MSHSACVIHMSHYHVNEASRKSEKKGKLLVKASLSVFLWIYSIGFTLRLIEANLIVTGSRDGHMVVTWWSLVVTVIVIHVVILALHDLNVVCSTGSFFYPFFIISCNNIDIGVWPGCELKGGRWDSKLLFQQNVMVLCSIWKVYRRGSYP